MGSYRQKPKRPPIHKDLTSGPRAQYEGKTGNPAYGILIMFMSSLGAVGVCWFQTLCGFMSWGMRVRDFGVYICIYIYIHM